MNRYRALLASLALVLAVAAPAAADNAVFFGSLGNQVVTELPVTSFTGNDFTLAARFMPQYVHGYQGPILAAAGGGLEVGVEDYRKGDGSYKDPGHPVMYLRIAGNTYRYLVLDDNYKAGRWQHVALVRQAGYFKLYLNGQLMFPFQWADHTFVGMDFAKSNGNLYSWYLGSSPLFGGGPQQRVVVGNPAELDAVKEPRNFTTPKPATSIVGVGISSSDSVYAWYSDATVTVGTSTDLDAHTGPRAVSLPPGKTMANVVDIAITAQDRVYTWWSNGTRSVGKSTDLDYYAAPTAVSLPAGKTLVGVAIDPSDRVHFFYSDDTFSIGTSTDADAHAAPQKWSAKKDLDRVQLLDTPQVPVAWIPTGVLTMGRRVGFSTRDGGQAYGLVDDVGVFTRALSAQEIGALKSLTKKFSGFETGLLRAYTFEDHGSRVPSTLTGAYQLVYWAKKVTLPGATKSSADAAVFASSLNLVYTSRSYNRELPFSAGEVWKVTQGHDDPMGSHNGYATFSLDLSRVDGPVALADVVAAEAGWVVRFRTDGCDAVGEDGRESCFVRMRYATPADGRIGTYMHQEPGSIADFQLGGGFDLDDVSDDQPFWIDEDGELTGTHEPVAQFAALGNVGDDARHLHYGENNSEMQQPSVFHDYCASNDQGQTWTYVFYGTPKKGQYLKSLRGTTLCQ